MKFKKLLATLLFFVFAGLCGYELATQIKASAERDISSVRYTRGIETPAKKEKKKQDFNLNRILQDTDLNG
ncbi:hypothetical protein [Maridesulfovibrio sp.]|uniref:hypothetical protein n=1 Tax=Maridesulfovibrio sp. TaxID=2795000 RepID=UPI003BABDA1E